MIAASDLAFKHIIIFKAPHTYSSHPCVTKLANGDWLVAFSQSIQRQPPAIHPPNDPQFVNLLCRSRDQGQTWELPSIAPNYDWYGVETPGLTQISSETSSQTDKIGWSIAKGPGCGNKMEAV